MIKRHILIGLMSLAAFCLIPAANAADHPPAHGAKAPAAANHGAHWSYEGEGAPEQWGRLNADFALCSSGQAQSPIDLHKTISAYLPEMYVQYKPGEASIVNNGHTIQVDVPAGSQMTIDGQRFALLQYHFHTPSEYAIEGRRYEMEVHFVHRNVLGQLGVIGIMIGEGAENPAAAALWSQMPKDAGARRPAPMLDPAAFFPASRSYFRFMGSLTTPPCSEGVHWHILTTPITFSRAQIDAFKSLFPMNARPLQPPRGRLIVLDR
jgi:carbonic anhydrase